jgi:quinol monooxygenase YgiN
VTVGLLVRLEAKPGRELGVENFLREALPLVDEEQAAIQWFAVRLGPASLAIIDAFPDDDGRRAHLNGKVAAALMDRADERLAQPPAIESFDTLAAKLPALAATR